MNLYADRAGLYDLIYHWKDYAAEAQTLRTVLALRGVSDGATLADVTCGTGAHLAHLRRWYRVQGVDIAPDMLALAAKRLPQVSLTCADLATWTPPEPVQVIVSLFSSFGYVRLDRQVAALANLRRALRPDGVLAVEPWLAPAGVQAGRPLVQTYASPELHLARGSWVEVDGRRSTLHFTWLVVPCGGPIETFNEAHTLWLQEPAELQEACLCAGFRSADWIEGPPASPRGLMVARR